MTTFGIILFIVILCTTIFMGIKDQEWSWPRAGLFIVPLVWFLCSIFGLIGLKYEKDSTFGMTPIASLGAKNDLEGHFSLGSGHIAERTYYYYVTENTFGYKVDKIENTGNIYIKEDANVKPYIEFAYYKVVHMSWFAKIFFTDKYYYDKNREIIFHVPKHTVIKDFNIDISNL